MLRDSSLATVCTPSSEGSLKWRYETHLPVTVGGPYASHGRSGTAAPPRGGWRPFALLLGMLLFGDASADEPLSAEARIAEARVRIDRGDLAGARILLEEAQRLDPAVELEATYLTGVAWELERDHPRALDTFRRLIEAWPEHARAQDSRFRVALTLADAGQPAEALRALREVGSPRKLKRADPTGGDAAKVRLCRATWSYMAHDTPATIRQLRAALAEPAPSGLAWFHGWGHLAVVRQELEHAEALAIGVTDREVRAWLSARTAHVETAKAELEALIELGEVWFILDGIGRFGHHFEDLADDLLAAPEPPGLSPTSRAILKANVELRALDQLVKARSYLQLGLDLALRVSWEGPEAAALQQEIDRLTARIEALDAP